MYESQYIQIETFTNVDGFPTFLRVEQNNGGVNLPPFLKIKSEITEKNYWAYSSKNMAKIGFKKVWI